MHLFASTFTQFVDRDNHRVKHGELAGPIFDMGPYPVNAARYVFGAEPIEVVSAAGTKHPESTFPQDFFDTVAVTLRFPGNRLAQFNLSYYGNPSNSLIVVGTKGTLELNPAYTFGKALSQTIVIGEEQSKQSFKNTDHFGGELKYFSDCILKTRHPNRMVKRASPMYEFWKPSYLPCPPGAPYNFPLLGELGELIYNGKKWCWEQLRLPS